MTRLERIIRVAPWTRHATMAGVMSIPRKIVSRILAAGVGTALLVGGLAVAADAAPGRPAQQIDATVRIDKLGDGDFAVAMHWHDRAGTYWEAVQAADGEGGLYLQFEQRGNGSFASKTTQPEVDIDNGRTHHLRIVDAHYVVTLFVDGVRVLVWAVGAYRD